MRGVKIQGGVEFSIRTDGESWDQGAVLSGVVKTQAPHCQVRLGYARERDLKALKAQAIDWQPGCELNAGPGETAFRFELPLSMRITDRSSTAVLIFGAQDSEWSAQGLLKVKVEPHLWIRDAIDAAATAQRFVVKSISALKDGRVEAKLEPSSAREMAMLQEVFLNWIVTDQELRLESEWVVTEVDSMSAGLKTKKASRNFEAVFLLKDCVLSFNQRIKKELIESVIAEQWAQVRAQRQV
jgi:hypothetical protein